MAVPIVQGKKTGGSVRICGDFKITVNSYLDIPEYSFPTRDKLLTRLNGGQFVLKIRIFSRV